jgi:hypothetical protein
MGEVLLSPDIEAAATSFLRTKLGSLAAKVATTVPATMPATMVKISLTGGGRDGIASDRAQLTIECWAPDAPTASTLARTAYAHMLAAPGTIAGGVFIRKAETVGGVQFFPDPDISKPRYQFTVRWFVRASAI